MRQYLKSVWVKVGLALLVVGAGPLLFIIVTLAVSWGRCAGLRHDPIRRKAVAAWTGSSSVHHGHILGRCSLWRVGMSHCVPTRGGIGRGGRSSCCLSRLYRKLFGTQLRIL